jgi:hypothetical protein
MKKFKTKVRKEPKKSMPHIFYRFVSFVFKKDVFS